MIDWSAYTFLLDAEYQMIVFALTSVAFFVLSYFIWRNGQRIGWKMLWLFVALTAMLGAVLQPAKWKYEPALKAVFVTDHADESLIDSLLEMDGGYRLFGRKPNNKYGESLEQVPNFLFPLQQYPQIASVAIVGDGLPDHELEALHSKQLDFYLNEALEGIVELDASSQVMEGETFYLSGKYQHRDSSTLNLFLETPSGEKRLLKATRPGLYDFNFQEKTKKSGRYLYHMVRKDDPGEVVEPCPIPLEVSPVRKPSVLVLNQAPTFETKYLVNWLSEAGYQVAARATISKGKYKETFYNRTSIDLKLIDQELLSNFDVYVLNEGAFMAMAPSEKEALRRQIEKGKGLLLLGGDQLKYASLPRAERDFFLDFEMISDVKKRFVPVLEGYSDLPETGKSLYRLKAKEGLFSIMKNKEGQVVAAYRLKGLGKVAISFLEKNYLLQLKGKKEAFQAIWNQHLQAIVPRYTIQNRWELVDPFLARINSPSTVHLYSSEKSPSISLKSDSTEISIPLRQDPALGEKWSGKIWFENTGWQYFSTKKNKKDKGWVYVPPKGTWKAMHRNSLIQANLDWQQKQERSNQPPTLRRNQLQPYPQWWFFLGFLLAMAMLWLEEKF